MAKKIIYILFIILTLGFFYNFGRQIYESLQSGSRFDREVEDLSKLQQKNFELKKRLEEVGSTQFIEEQARDKLNLSRSGETMMIIPQEEINKILEAGKPTPTPLPNWQGWLKLII